MAFRILLSTLLISLLPLLARADQKPDNCIQVEVNGFKALSFECLNQQLANSNAQMAARKNLEQMNVPIYKQAPNKLGLFNQSATSIRMGNTFGTSVHPQRPASN